MPSAAWRTPEKYRRNRNLLVALIILSAFIFTPTAEQIGRSPRLVPLLTIAAGLFSLFTVLKATRTDAIQPFVRGFIRTYRQDAEPKRYWASLAWNTALGFFLVWAGVKANEQLAVQPLEDRCFDTQKTTAPPREKLAACNRLIAAHDRTGTALAGVIEARGTAYYRLSDFRRARADYTSAIRLDPGESSSRFNRALVDEQLGQPQAAIDDFGAAIGLSPDDADARLNRALLLLNVGKFDLAIDDLTHVIATRPRDSVALANRGLAYAWKDEPALASRDFATARAIVPSSIVLLHGEALLADDSGDLDVALARLDEALRHDPKDLWSLDMRAKVYRQLRKPARAQADIETLRRLTTAGGRSDAAPSHVKT